MSSTVDNPQQLRKLEILVIENDPAAARLTKEAFKEAGIKEGVYAVPDGDEALNYLLRKGKHSSVAEPDIIFLDLHLPKKSGLQVLRELKSNPALAATPVVVISGSDDPAEIREAYELHASCYVRKPENLDEFLAFVTVCYEFWGRHVVFPPKSHRA